ncbi:MAG: class I SAM-dependent methyltransferase [Actinobacteria bacterium]|nr:class I SAM-dependent methyltransferase [Actinomycetota bacterium]
MHRFFDSTIRPLLDVTRLSTMVEVGAEQGLHTARLLPYAVSRRAHLHVIDPEPLFATGQFRRQYSDHATLHQQISHDVLPSLGTPDVAFLDGDHNWYTVYEELRILDRTCGAWPLTFLHDIEWPYGRRDLYYAPERLPAEHCHPHASSGIVPGQSELAPEGFNASLINATHEGGPRNGVLTAIEDFLDATERELSLFIAPGNNGLAIVVDRKRLRKRRFAQVLRRVHDARAGAELSPRHASSALAAA